MTNDLQKSLKRYSAAAAALIATGAAADAQVVYTQANKIITATNPIDSIDINTDGISDFSMAFYNDVYAGFNVTSVYGFPLNSQGHALAGSSSSSSYFPFKLNSGTVINTQMFLPSNAPGYFTLLLNGAPVPAPVHWNGGIVDGYMGIKLQFGPNTHFGWVRMDIDSAATQIVIKDMAYNSTPNGMITAGQGLSLDTYADIANSVWATGKTIHSEVIAPYQTGSITITDINGKTVTSFDLNHTKEAFDASNLATGTYVLTIKLDEDSISKKVILN